MSLRVDAPALAAVGLLLIFTSCTRTQTVEATSGREGAPAVPVAPVVRRDLSRDLELAAEFRPYQEVDLHAKVAGYLKAIHVEVGDRVHAGELIAELEAPEMAQEKAHASASLRRTVLEVERARGEVVRAEADLEIRRISYDRLAGVMKARPNLVARQEVDTLSARLRESQAQLGSAKAALAAVQEQVQAATATREKVNTVMSFLRITAPFDGVVTRRMADPGEMIQAGTASHVQAQPVIRLSQIDRLRLVLPVPESVAGRVRLRGPVEVRIDSLQRVIQGRISRFTEKLDTATRTMETEVDIANPGHEIRPGMFGYARLLIDRRPDALSVPVQAVSGQHSKATVLVVNSRKRIEEREVDLGIETPDAVEVLGGLKEQELVVVGSRSRLKPGMTVEARRIEAPRGH